MQLCPHIPEQKYAQESTVIGLREHFLAFRIGYVFSPGPIHMKVRQENLNLRIAFVSNRNALWCALYKWSFSSFWETIWNKTSLRDSLVRSEAGPRMMSGLSTHHLGRKWSLCIRKIFISVQRHLPLKKKNKKEGFAESWLKLILFLPPTSKRNLDKLFSTIFWRDQRYFLECS